MLQDTAYLKYETNEKSVYEFFHGLFFLRERNVIDALKGFCQLKGFAIDDYMSCHFAEEFPNENDEEYFGKEGVVFYLDYPAVPEDVVVVLTKEEFYKVVEENYGDYLAKSKEEKEEILRLLKELKRKLEK